MERQRETLMGVLTAHEQVAPEQAPQLMTDEAMNQAFGTSSEEDEGYEDEGRRSMRWRQTGVTRTGLNRTGSVA
jgi:hypothetical protein